MDEETQFLQKIQGAYAAQSAEAKRALNSLMFEYEPVLARFAALQQEVQRAQASVADLDVNVLVERFRPALQTASRLAVDIDMLDDDVRDHADLAKLLAQMQARLGLTSASVYAEKFDALVNQLTQAQSPPQATPTPAPAPEPAAPPAPAPSGDALLLAKAEDLYFGDNGQTQDLVQAAVLFHRLADKKNPKALARLAAVYGFGEGVKHDRAKQLQFLRQAAEAGEPGAMASLSNLYRHGLPADNGIPQDFDQAKFWALRASEAGAREAGWALGALYADEKFPEFNPLIALGHYQQGSEAGSAWATIEMGDMHRSGTHIPKNTDKAIACYELSVQQGVRQSGSGNADHGISRLVRLYEFGDGVPADLQKALTWYNRASPETKRSIAYGVGCQYEYNEAKALSWFTEGAALNCFNCMRMLGDQFAKSGPTQNLAQAEKWYLKSAELAPESPWGATFHLCQFYSEAGANPNFDKWLIWAEKRAALLDDDSGYAEIGREFYYSFRKKPKHDVPTAIRYLMLGLSKKGGSCALALAEIYKRAEGYVNLQKAEEFYKLAISKGYDCSFSLGCFYKTYLEDIDKAIAVFASGAENGDGFHSSSLIDCLLDDRNQHKNVHEAKRVLARWRAKPEWDAYDYKYAFNSMLEHPEIRDVKELKNCCDWLLASKSSPNDKCEVCYHLGKFLLDNEDNRDEARGIAYLERAGMQDSPYYHRTNAIERLIRAYAEGKHGVAVDEAKAAYWRAELEKAKA